MRFLLLLLLAQAPTPQALFEQRRYAEAAALLEPQSSRPARYLLGLCYQQLGDLAKAESVFAALITKEPNWPPAHYALARVFFMEGKFPEAIRAAESAEKLGEPKARTRRLIGSIEEERANWDAALAAYDAALRAGANPAEIKAARDSVTFKRGPAPNGPALTPVAFERHPLPFVLNHNPTPEKHIVSTMAGGLAIFDYNNDGLPDLFFTNGASLPDLQSKHPNRLYKNLGGLQFEDVTAQAGLTGEGFSIAAAPADFDGDGWVDLFVAGAARNLLYRNNRGQFTLQPRGIKDENFAAGAAWLDYDSDGKLDLFLVNYLDWTPAFSKRCGEKIRVYCHPREFPPTANRLYRNLGNGQFADVSAQTGIAAHRGKGMSAAVADIDGDNLPDIFVANDALPNFLFKNTGGKFTESALALGVAYNDLGQPISSMGSDLRDYDNDGRPDLIITALTGETFPLFKNTPTGFRDVTYPSGAGALTVRRSGWGVALADLNNDGWKDLVTANSHVTDTIELTRSEKYKEPNLVLLNAAGKFQPGAELGPPAAHRGLAVADLDGDGRLDIVTTALGENAVIWRNITKNSGHWLEVNAPIGSRVRAGSQWQEVTSGSSYGSGSLLPAHFGLGAATTVDVEILLPNGQRKSLGILPARP
jgi:tetratricopeptide (TPR) repeat protein